MHAYPLVEAYGLKGLTLRNLAHTAGISPSLLTYRHGSRDGLLSAVFAEARSADETAWAMREKTFNITGTEPGHLLSIALATVTDSITRTRQTSLMQWICFTAAEREPAAKPAAAGWPQLSVDYWTHHFVRLGVDSQLSAPFAAALTGATRIGLLADGNPLLLSWMNDFIIRLCQRIGANPPSPAGDSHTRAAVEQTWRDQPRHAPASRSDTPDRIIDAAAGLLVSHGPDALTHRLIAEQTGISLSSMTHHFSSLDEIMLYAFERIYDRARTASSADLPQGINIERLSQEVLPEIFRRARARGQESVAMDEVILSAARKSETAPLAGALMAMTGQTSTALLRSVEGLRESVDRLDGQLFRFVMTGLSEQSAHLPGPERDTWLAAQSRKFLLACWASG
ncbi:TetR/AcrR family transcriptional regulator [Henriciella sp.]|uniref:TetR/AcrR family transcriptional regulator n=1 Tax=Henriciella sp. TaxID=1968823 RepID=UPI00263182F0|nr:TetR/AcrR family transcriptional regulator [Henriciella sp.]